MKSKIFNNVSKQAATPKVWLLLGQKAGDNNQVLALAEQLGWPWESKHIVNRPTELLSNLLLKVTLAGIDHQRSNALAAPWPDLIISSGRRNEPVARWIRQQSGNRTRLVHIGRPWSPLAAWDLIVTTPQYFLPQADNILHNRLPLHRIGPDQLNKLKNDHQQPWSHLPRPYTAVLLGGDSGQFGFTREKGERLGKLVNELAQARGGSLLVTDSRRTPSAASDGFWSQISVPAFRHSWRDTEVANPYLNFLAMTDRFVVTGESMSMLAEAQSTGKPLYIFDLADQQNPWWLQAHNFRYKPLSHRLAMAWGPERMRRDISRIQDALVNSGGACWLENWQDCGESGDISPDQGVLINEATVAAERVKALFTH